MRKTQPGLFISFEGGEGVGKSTQIKLLASYLKKQGHQVVTTREPGGTTFAEKLRKIHKTENISGLTELFLIEASRSDHITKVIRPALDQGKIVLCDRFSESTSVYQGYVRGLDLGLVRKMNQMASDGIRPSCVLWFDLDWKTLQKRLKKRQGPKDRFDHEKASFHKKILSAYRSLAREQKRPLLQRINANQSVEKIHEEVLARLKPHLRKL